MTLKRSNIEFAKRVFLDRLTTDAQPLSEPVNVDAGPGDRYEYGGVYNPYNFGVGADCSGSAGIFIGAAVLGPTKMSWSRQFSTETFNKPSGQGGPFGSHRVTRDELLRGNHPIKICLQHGGGGPNSHMNISIDDWLMESNGRYGTCTLNHGAIAQDAPLWNDFWVIEGPIDEDTDWRQPRRYPYGVDYACGPIAGKDLKAAGVSFVCRYITDGNGKLPNKLMTRREADDLQANGIEIISNWENYATRMREGYAAGEADARAANAKHLELGGPCDAPIYFSCDYDAPECDQTAINEYLRACGDVLGGPHRVGVYGGYWPLSRALNAGVCHYAWQTEAWSGHNVDSRVNIVQRNRVGFQYVAGVQCDLDEAHTEDFGQWSKADVKPQKPTTQPVAVKLPNEELLRLIYEQLCGPIDPGTGYGTGWPQLGQNADGKNLYLVDAVARLRTSLESLQGSHNGAAQSISDVIAEAGPPVAEAGSDGGRRSLRGRRATSRDIAEAGQRAARPDGLTVPPRGRRAVSLDIAPEAGPPVASAPSPKREVVARGRRAANSASKSAKRGSPKPRKRSSTV